MTRYLRVRKVFIDWSQNADYKTTVAPYSLRATSGGPFVSLPVRWEEIEQARKKADLYFTPDDALARVKREGDLWSGLRRRKQHLDGARAAPRAQKRDRGGGGEGTGARKATREIRLPRPGSQSGRRLFVLPKTEMGSELWLDVDGKFKRWILRPDRGGGPRLVAMPAGEFPVDPSYYRGEVPAEWRARVSLDDAGVYEVIEGGFRLRRLRLFFTGKVLSGEWTLRKVTDDARHRSWMLEPASSRT